MYSGSERSEAEFVLAVKYEIKHLDNKMRSIKANREKLVKILKDLEK